MIVHLRTCIHKGKRQKFDKTRIKKKISNQTVVSQYRLRCDVATFGSTQDYIRKEVLGIIPNRSSCTLLRSDSNNTPKLNGDTILSQKLMLMLARICRKTGKADVDPIISTLSDPNFSLDEFRKVCSKAGDCLAEDQRVAKTQLADLEYRCITISDPDSEIRCDIHVRSVLKLLREQIKNASESSAIFNPPATGSVPNEYSHPMLAELGTKCEPIVREEIMQSVNKEEMWRNAEKSGEQSFVGMIQLYSDKSRSSLKDSAFQFYPLHVTLLNFSESYRRNCIQNGSTNIAFLPVQYYKCINGEKVVQAVDRLSRLKMLHLSISFILSDLRSTAYEGFSCSDKDERIRICHPCLGSYSCDLPEGKDLTSVRNGNNSNRNCHRSLALTTDFNKYSNAPKRNGEKENLVSKKIEELRKAGKRKESQNLMDEYSLVEQRPCLFEFPFLHLDPMLDYHSIFNFESLHNFHLGVSKDLKRCLSERLRSTDLKSAAPPTSSGAARIVSFKMVRTTVLCGINKMLEHIQRESPAKGLHIDFSRSGKGFNWNGIYVEDGKLMGMLESKDYRSLDMVSPFMGMCTDRCCDEVSGALTTRLFVRYVDLMQKALSYNTNPVIWNKHRLQELEQMIKLFKIEAVSLYSKYQASELCTEKFHQLDHIVEDIRKYGGIRYGDAGLYESAHTDIKCAYRSGSKRKSSAMKETVAVYVKEKNRKLMDLAESAQPPVETTELHRGLSKAMECVAIVDIGKTVSNGKKFVLSDLERGRRILRKIRIAREQRKIDLGNQLRKVLNTMDETIRDLLLDLGETASRVLYNELLNAIPLEDGTTSSLNIKGKITRVASAHIPGITPPTADDYHKSGNEISVKPSKTRIHQRLVSTRGFYGSPHLRQDSVLVNAPARPGSRKINLWAAKVLGLFRVPSSQLMNASTGTGVKEVTEVAFVQFYEIVSMEDGVDTELGCVKLIWATCEDENVESDSSPGRKWYSLLPLSCILGVVHIVRDDYGIQGRGAVSDMDAVPWDKQTFYINRFYYDPLSIQYECLDE